MAKLAVYASHFETMRTHASYTVDGHLETLDRHDHADSVKTMKARVNADGARTHLVVMHYTEDGEDKTEDAQKKAQEREEKRDKERDKDKDKKHLRMPLLAEEQPRYTFDQVEVDAKDPMHVRIAFAPKVPADDTIEGTAWVDARTGSLISAGFKLNKTPTFVDYVHFTVEFGAPTDLGPAVSSVVVEGQGGILFFRKRFRGTATLSDYHLLP
jgi:hypothetical protein